MTTINSTLSCPNRRKRCFFAAYYGQAHDYGDPLKRPASKYNFRKSGQARRPTRRVAAKVLTLQPAIVP